MLSSPQHAFCGHLPVILPVAHLDRVLDPAALHVEAKIRPGGENGPFGVGFWEDQRLVLFLGHQDPSGFPVFLLNTSALQRETQRRLGQKDDV